MKIEASDNKVLQNESNLYWFPSEWLNLLVLPTDFYLIEPKLENREGLWTRAENELYLDFLMENTKAVGSKKVRRSKKMFKQMSYLVKTRTAVQCRSHHQKMIRRFKHLDRIIAFLTRILRTEADVIQPNLNPICDSVVIKAETNHLGDGTLTYPTNPPVKLSETLQIELNLFSHPTL